MKVTQPNIECWKFLVSGSTYNPHTTLVDCFYIFTIVRSTILWTKIYKIYIRTSADILSHIPDQLYLQCSVIHTIYITFEIPHLYRTTASQFLHFFSSQQTYLKINIIHCWFEIVNYFFYINFVSRLTCLYQQTSNT